MKADSARPRRTKERPDGFNRTRAEEFEYLYGIAQRAWDHVFAPKEVLTVTEWACRYRWFAEGQSWKSQEAPAQYDIADAPFQQEPQDSLTDPAVYAHVWLMASRIAKTVMMGNGFGYFSDYDSATQLFMYPTQEDANLRSKDEFQPLIDASPRLQGRYQARRGGEDNTISYKKFEGGNAAFIGSNAPSKLRARTARVIWCDEADAYRPSSGAEGDPVWLAFNRAKNYEEAVRVIASSPTVKGHSTIMSWFEKSDQRKWFVQCVKCGAWQVMTWAQYRWPENRRDKCRFHCEMCDYGHDERQRDRIIRAGQWRPTAAFTNIRGYFLPGYYNIFPHASAFKGKMHEMAEEVHRAKHSQNPAETTRVLVNTFFTEPYQEETDVPPDWQQLLLRRETYDRNSLPAGVKTVTFGTDFQADRIEVVFWGHGKEEEKWRIEKQVLFGDPRMPHMYADLEKLLTQPFRRTDGAVLKPRSGGFDTGYFACMRTLYGWLRPRQRWGWFAFKGASTIEAEVVSRGVKSKVLSVSLLLVGTHKIKALIYDRANIITPGPGYLHFPMSMKEDDFGQLFREESRSVFKAGVQFKKFGLPATGSRRNEELDCAVLAHAALYARGFINWDFEEKQNLLTVVDSEESKRHVAWQQKQAQMVRMRRARTSNLMRGLRGW
jgi:phage terminase large subunit GpA-like protein